MFGYDFYFLVLRFYHKFVGNAAAAPLFYVEIRDVLQPVNGLADILPVLPRQNQLAVGRIALLQRFQHMLLIQRLHLIAPSVPPFVHFEVVLVPGGYECGKGLLVPHPLPGGILCFLARSLCAAIRHIPRRAASHRKLLRHGCPVQELRL